MKKLIIAGLLTIAFGTASFSKEYVVTGKTHTTLGDYTIEPADKPVSIGGTLQKAYIISYQNSPLTVTVAVVKDNNCENFIVLSDKLSVQYVCTGAYFGVKKLDKALAPDGFSKTDEALNREEYFHQRVIINGHRETIENTQLIAAYFPMLINKEVLTAM
jgi:hypothetical protein